MVDKYAIRHKGETETSTTSYPNEDKHLEYWEPK